MVLTGFLRLLSSGMLLLLATMTTTTTLVQRAGATTAADDDGAADACDTESSACSLDSTCSSCNLVAFSGSTEYTECFDADVSAGDDGDDLSVFTSCSGYMVGPCCVDEVSDLECLENDLFVELKLCTIESLGCSADEITCRGDDDDDDDDSAVGASNGASASLGAASFSTSLLPLACYGLMRLLPFLWG